MNPSLSIEFLNHASLIIRFGNISLLSDPWYSGTCFKGNWGLRFLNPGALEKATQCTHLWISHPHQDHFHVPTLKQLVGEAPNLQVLANISDNMDMGAALQKIGFNQIISLKERRKLRVSENIHVTRYPATRSDNMLLIEMGGIKLLNYNDCNLPQGGLKALVRKMGSIDILLLNFNHANKLMPYPSHEAVKAQSKNRFLKILEAVRPKWTVPFASHHYYRSPFSEHQNGSLLTSEDLALIAPKIIPLAVGDILDFFEDQEPIVHRHSPVLDPSVMEQKKYEHPADWNSLKKAAQKYCHRLKRSFWGIPFLIRPVNVWVTDYGRMLRLDVRKGVEEFSSDATAQMKAHSEALMDCFNTPFGTDTFWIGGDFSFEAGSEAPISRMLLMGTLMENKLSLWELIKIFFDPRKWGFFFNRREEIVSIIMGGKFKVGERL